ncbi:hypothetical protein [Bradyrhizobium sp. AUGA SZCCT0431]|uniref:hypothetical protein n=1 Tax=Bradyrhizobium sp. AUGA SZCCT0431 TaxID=2807674 RepID=UPI001BAADD8D|nr:hypothetical protein [Bradyrhizobium sp. AUGA SZCCT0431]MBR1147678.1 hypothetical protein [Bradyrhizobium sp. AUGA SZCCT0431]
MADCAFDYWPGAFWAGAGGALNRLISNASNPGISEMRNPQARMALNGPPKPTIAGYIISKNPLIKTTGIANANPITQFISSTCAVDAGGIVSNRPVVARQGLGVQCAALEARPWGKP